MTELESTNWFHLIYAHYNYIHIFSNNEKYVYKPFGIFKKSDKFVLQFDITETNKTEYESTENYRTDYIFNQEPKLLKAWQGEPSIIAG